MLNSTERGDLFDIFAFQSDHHCTCAQKWCHFSHFSRAIKQKNKALRPKMTKLKIASRGPALKLPKNVYVLSGGCTNQEMFSKDAYGAFLHNFSLGEIIKHERSFLTAQYIWGAYCTCSGIERGMFFRQLSSSSSLYLNRQQKEYFFCCCYFTTPGASHGQ